MDGFRTNIGLQRYVFSPHIYKFLASLSPLLLFPLAAAPPLVGCNRCRRSSIFCSSQLPRLLDLPRQLWLLWPREHSHVPRIHSPIRLQVTGSLVGCTSPVLVSLLGLPALSPAFGLVSHPHLLLLKTAIAVQLLLIFTINLISGDRLPWSGGIVRSPKRRSRLGNTFVSSLFFFFSG